MKPESAPNSGKVHLLTLHWALLLFTLNAVFTPSILMAQCAPGYNQAQVNWDHLDYFSRLSAYSSYVTSTQAATQKFAMGPNSVTITTSTSIGWNGDDSTHTGDLAGYTGADVHYNPTSDGQTITITFTNEVMNASFALYDIDQSAVFTVTAANSAAVAQNVSVTLQASTILSIGGTPTARTITANSTSLGNSDNRGSAIISVAGPVKTIVIICTTRGSDATFWLSDIVGCVTGSFPNDYEKLPSNRPFTGQPDYFLVTPDNNSVYMMNPATGKSWHLFTEAGATYVNSLAYDAKNHWLYYVLDATSSPSGNRSLKKYDFNTETSSVVVADIKSTLGIMTFNQGVESAGASYYDDALYIGIEGGASGRESIIWRIDFSGATPTGAYQVWAMDAYTGSNSLHDWGDFMVKDGSIIDFNTARKSGPTYPFSAYHHYDMVNSSMVTYNNPNSSLPYAGQAGMSWSGTLYMIRDSVYTYNEDGTTGPGVVATTVTGPAWVGNAGDASENFRPKSDFGDAPASYDPDPLSPATHELDSNLRLGSTYDREWQLSSSSGATADGADEDGIGAAPILNFDATLTYGITVSVYNNTGSDATLAGWLDYNFNGVFDAGEGVTVTVPSNASQQMVPLTWNNIWVVNTAVTQTFLRLRIARSSDGMTAANMTGWFPDGEVEDYAVVMGAALPKDIESFSLNKQNESMVKLNWTINVQQTVDNFEILRNDKSSGAWKSIGTVNAKPEFGRQDYTYTDLQPFPGTNYYRIRVNYKAANTNKLTEIKSATIDVHGADFRITPNPVSSNAKIEIIANSASPLSVQVVDKSGRVAMQKIMNVAAGYNAIRLDNLGSLAAGTYLVVVRLDGKVLKSKMVVFH